jgi:PAS domain S-box-containing protein
LNPSGPEFPLAQPADHASVELLPPHSEVRLLALFESAMDGIVTIDGTQRIVLFNKAAEQMFRCDAAAAIGQPITRFMPERYRAHHGSYVQDFATTGVSTRRMGRIGAISGLRADGEEFPIEASISQVVVAGQKLFTVILRDATERVQNEQRLREQQETVAAVIDAASDAVVSCDEGGRIVLFNPAAERIFGRTAASMMGHKVDVLIPSRFRPGHDGNLRGFVHSEVTRRALGAGRVKGLRSDGEEVELEASISRAQVNGRLTLTAILRDVTQRARAEEALLRYQTELSDLAQRLMHQEKETTRRLAQALHDQLGQTLTAIRLTFDAAPKSAAVDTGPTTPRLDQLINTAIAQVRQVLVDLRPPLLDDDGLAAALDNELLSRDRLFAGVDLLLEVEPEVARLRWPTAVEYAAFMVVREATANALQHADASLVRVVLAGDAARLRVEVINDGRGWPEEAQTARPGHLGVVGMRERAQAIGAQFTISSNPNGGGSVVCLEWLAPEPTQ